MQNYYFVIVSLLLHTSIANAQKIWHVNIAATGANTGQNWANAFTDLHSGLAAAQPGDAVWVAGGTYRPDAGTDRNRYFELKSGVRLYGGFAGTETNLSQRILGTSPSTLSGNIGNTTDSTDNAYTILYMAYPDAGTWVSGFTFRHGYARSDTSFLGFTLTNNGGAVFIRANDSIALPTFEHCIFRDNLAKKNGGAIYIRGTQTQACTPVFRYCEFFNNLAFQNGGAICWTGGSPFDRGIEFDHCKFVKNRAFYEGGGIYYEHVSGAERLNFQNCLITDNVAWRRAGFFSMAGLANIRWGVHFDSCTMTRNEAQSEGAAIFANTTFVFPDYYFKVSHCDLSENLFTSATTGGGDFLIEGLGQDTAIFSGNRSHSSRSGGIGGAGAKYCLVEGNVVENNLSGGCGAFSEDGTAIVRGNIIRNNQNGGGVGVLSLNGNGIIEGNTLHNNGQGDTIGLYKSPSLSISAPNGYVYNNIVEGQNVIDTFKNARLILEFGSGTTYCFNNLFANNRFRNSHDEYMYGIRPAVSLNYNNIYSNNLDAFTGKIDLPLRLGGDSSHYFAHNLMDVACGQWPRTTCGPGNLLAADALFVNAAAGDFRLQPCSPAINAGTNQPLEAFGVLRDLAGLPRIQDGTADIGPYESQPLDLALLPKIKAACQGEANAKVVFDLLNGCQPLKYQWTNGISVGTGVDNLAPGTYTFTITDGKQKAFVTTLTVPASSPEVVLSGDTITCAESNSDGHLAAQLSSGFQPATYQWSNAATEVQINDLANGTYTVTATDAFGCTDAATATISDASVPTLDTIIQNATGPTAPNGSVSVVVSGGIGPYRYKWSSSDTAAAALNLKPGKYTLTVTDGEKCVYAYSFEVGFTVSTAEPVASFRWVLPNPADTQVEISSFESGDWQLVSPDGRVVKRVEIQGSGVTYRIDTADLPSAVYLYVFRWASGQQAAGRLLIAH